MYNYYQFDDYGECFTVVNHCLYFWAINHTEGKILKDNLEKYLPECRLEVRITYSTLNEDRVYYQCWAFHLESGFEAHFGPMCTDLEGHLRLIRKFKQTLEE